MFFYYVPLFLMLVVGQSSEHQSVDEYWIFISLIYVVLFHVCLEIIRPIVYNVDDIPQILRMLYRFLYSKNFKFAVITIYFCVSLILLARYGIGIRQGTDRISDIGAMALLLFMLRPVLFFQILEEAFFQESSGSKVTKWLSIGCIAAYPIAAFDMFWALLRIFVPVFLHLKKVRLNFLIKISAFCLVFVIATIFFGLANKVGYEEAQAQLMGQRDNSLGQYLFMRMAVVSQSLNLGLADVWNMDRDPMQSVEVCKEAILYRLSLLTGLYEYDRPIITSVNRLNFLRLCYFDRVTEPGATPGFLALPLFFPIWWFCAVVVMFVVVSITFLLDFRFRKIREDRNKWILISLLLIPVTFAFLYNPLDLFTSIGPPTFILLMIVGFAGGPVLSGDGMEESIRVPQSETRANRRL